MKNFAIFALALIVAFAMCSCQPTAENLDGKVEFKVNVGGQVAKALTATDPAKADVTEVQLAFMVKEQVSAHINCEYKIGSEDAVYDAQFDALSSNEVPEAKWISGLLDWDATNGVATWSDDATMYLSQGKWTIYARAINVDATTEAVKVLYEGDATVFVNKREATANIIMVPKASTATGTLTLNGLKASKVFEDIENERLAYTVVGLTGANSVSKTELEADTDNGDGTITFKNGTEELKQGSYLLTVTLEQNTGTDETPVWTDYTGGSVIDFGIYEDLETVVSGDVEASDYIATTVGAKIEKATFALTVDNTTANSVKVENGTYDASFMATISTEDEDAYTATLYWYIDGKLYNDGGITLDGATTSTITPTLNHGKHNIQAIVVGYSGETAKTAGKIDAKSNLSTIVLDTRNKF